MDNRQKRILSIVGLIAVVAMFSFGWLIVNNDKGNKSVLANDKTEVRSKEQTSTPPADDATNEDSTNNGDEGMGSIFNYNQSDEAADSSEEEDSGEVIEHINENNPTSTKKPDIVTLGSVNYLKIQSFIKDDGYTNKTELTFKGWSKKEHFTFGGASYPEGLGLAVDYGTRSNMSTVVVRYLLNGEYTKLVGEVGIDDKSVDSKGDYRIDFYSQNRDNSTTYLGEVTGFKPGQFPIPFEIDVTDVPALLIELVKLDEKDDDIHIAIINSSFQ